MAEVYTIFSDPLAFQVILPFLLVFTLIFAVLTKSNVLGNDKKQINAIVALVMGLIVVSFGNAVYIINNLIPFLAVSLVIILVFMVLAGALYEPDTFKLHKNVKYTFMGIIAIALTIAVLYFTGAWDYLYDSFVLGEGSSVLVTNAIFIILIVGVVAFVLWGAKPSSSSSSSSSGKKE